MTIRGFMDALRLFQFPTFMGTPERVPISSLSEAYQFVIKHEGKKGLHIDPNGSELRMISFEFDAINSFVEMAEEVRMFCRRLDNYGLQYMIVFSGNKSYNIWLPIKSIRVVNKETISSIFRRVNDVLKLSDFKTFDRHSLTASKMVRLINTRHEKTGYRCIQVYDVSFRPPYTKLFSEVTPVRSNNCEVFVPGRVVVSSSGRELIESPEVSLDQSILELLPEIVRPCVLNSIMNCQEPSHMARTAFVSELMFKGFTEGEVNKIIEIIASLPGHWVDYNRDITAYHVRKIYEKKLKPPSCHTLMTYGICDGRHPIWWEVI